MLKLEKVGTLRKVWQQHYTRDEAGDEVRWRHGKETLRAAALIESRYDVEVKYSRKDVTKWTSYKVHLSESCDELLPHLITNVHTTAATTQDVASTADIQEMLLSFLIDNFLLGKQTPFPLPTDIPKDYPKGAYQHSVSCSSFPEVPFDKVL